MLLELDGVQVHHGAVEALGGVSLHVDEGEVVALVGGNGAGKTTALRAISGLRPLTAGTIRFAGRDLARVPAHRRVAAGIAHAPEGRRIFAAMTVHENLVMGSYRRRASQAAMAPRFDEVFDLFPLLARRRHQAGGTLSGGEQQMLAIGRALMSAPRLLLLDEPSTGLAPMLVSQLFDAIGEIAGAAPPSWSPSSTRPTPCGGPTGPTCWTPDRSCVTTPERSSWPRSTHRTRAVLTPARRSRSRPRRRWG